MALQIILVLDSYAHGFRVRQRDWGTILIRVFTVQASLRPSNAYQF
jgi:hypothetical protein